MSKNKRSMMESEIDVKDIVVIDNGNDTVKIGVSGEDHPRMVLDTVCGIPNIQNENDSLNNKPQLLFGSQLKTALKEKKYEVQVQYPMSNGKIENLDQMRDIWIYALEEGLQISELSSANLLIIDQCSNTKDYKHKIAEVLFDYLKVQSLLFMNSSTLSLFSTGSTTGLSLELGHSLNTVVPIFQGYPITHAIQTSNISGELITKCLEEDLLENKLEIQGNELEKWGILKDIKEKMCSVSLDYYSAIKSQDSYSDEEKSYELPDKSVITIDPKTRYRCTETLFNSSLVGRQTYSLPEMMADSLNRCESELQVELVRNIVFGGGTSMFKGMLPRVQKELLRLMPKVSKSDMGYVADFHRRYSSWIGGSMLGSLNTFQQLAITRADYEENPEGKVSIIHKRTF